MAITNGTKTRIAATHIVNNAIERAIDIGLSRPEDIAIHIVCALQSESFKISANDAARRRGMSYNKTNYDRPNCRIRRELDNVLVDHSTCDCGQPVSNFDRSCSCGRLNDNYVPCNERRIENV